MTLHLKLADSIVILALALCSLSLAAREQALEYSTIDVDGRVIITVPAHWHVNDTATRKNIAAYADAVLNPTGKLSNPIHVSSLAVASMPKPIRAIIRVSFVQGVGTQDDLNREVVQNRNQVLADVKASWEAEKETFVEGMAKQGIKYLGQESYNIEKIGARTAMVLSYKRSSITGGAPFVVTQYHVPMGTEKVLITLSYQESHAAVFRPILERVRNSIVIRH
jgi:hypothetical protein